MRYITIAMAERAAFAAGLFFGFVGVALALLADITLDWHASAVVAAKTAFQSLFLASLIFSWRTVAAANGVRTSNSVLGERSGYFQTCFAVVLALYIALSLWTAVDRISDHKSLGRFEIQLSYIWVFLLPLSVVIDCGRPPGSQS